MLLPVLFAAILVVVQGGRSPNADFIENYLRTSEGSRYSNNIALDAILDVPALVARYHYPIEVHHAVTSDGYILQLHRIPHGRDNNQHGSNKPIAFIMHGLLSSSADFLSMGPGDALGYLLAEAGFDVWLGNARGNYYSRNHQTMNPDTNNDFWRFSWDEIGYYDLAAMVDYVLFATRQPKLHYIGHSQGGTSFLTLTALRPEYSNKFYSFHGLAPASFFTNNDHVLINTFAPYQSIIETAAFAAGFGELLPKFNASFSATIASCVDQPQFQPLCQVFPLIGLDLNKFNTTVLPVLLGHAPAGCSIRQLAHYAQSINTGEFRRYDYGLIGNMLHYGSRTPPAYDLSGITTPAYLYYSLGDVLVHHEDLLQLSTHLNLVELYKVRRDDFLHVDFIWGRDVRDMINIDLITRLLEADQKYR